MSEPCIAALKARSSATFNSHNIIGTDRFDWADAPIKQWVSSARKWYNQHSEQNTGEITTEQYATHNDNQTEELLSHGS